MAGIEGLKYLGGGFIGKVPARDLTATEVFKYGKKRLIESGLYAEYEPVVIEYEEDIEVLNDELEAIENTFEED